MRALINKSGNKTGTNRQDTREVEIICSKVEKVVKEGRVEEEEGVNYELHD